MPSSRSPRLDAKRQRSLRFCCRNGWFASDRREPAETTRYRSPAFAFTRRDAYAGHVDLLTERRLGLIQLSESASPRPSLGGSYPWALPG